MESNLSLYKIFLATAECGNISAAARKLYISQPAVSKAISKLETNLGITLFARMPKGVMLTQEGKILYDKVKFAFDSIDSGEEIIKNICAGEGGQLRIGASNTLIKHVLLPYLRTFREVFPQIHLTVESQSTYKTLSLLEEGKIDIGLIGMTNDSKSILPNVKYTQIAEVEDIFVANEAYIKELNNKDILKNCTLILLDEENLTRQYIDHYLATNNIDPTRIIEATSMDLLVDFAQIGLGVACVIKQFVSNELSSKSLIEVNAKIRIPKRSIGFVYMPDALPSKAAQRFVNHFEL